MLLILTNSRDVTADYLARVLSDSHVPYQRLDTDTLVSLTHFHYTCSGCYLRVGDAWLEPGQVKNIWYRRPEELKGSRFEDSPAGRCALDEWTHAIEGFLAHVPASRWMNHPSVNALASNKLEQLTVARELGLSIPETLVTQEPGQARDFFKLHQGRVVVKPMAGGYVSCGGETGAIIYTSRVRESDMDCCEELRDCPTMFQRYIPKQCDVRITVVDRELSCVELRASDEEGLQRCDIRRHNMAGVDYVVSRLPTSVERSVRRLVEHYQLRFAAIDMVVDSAGEFVFLEVNPNGQWAWLDLAGGASIADSFVRAFE
jgi:glutathione synthase/RimK-type ligase-like ATP-grasp enzyme